MSSWVVVRRDADGKTTPLPRTMSEGEAHEYAARMVPRGFEVLALDVDAQFRRLPRLDTGHDVEHDS